ncbi:Glutamate--methylamine ligase [bacterium HR32]|nr:Glutamate--methylamine ligase [bacterium HR32]
MTEEELEALDVRVLPRNLGEAVDAFLADEVLCEALGSHVVADLVKAKRQEWREYVAQVHAWEVERYLTRF